MLTELVQDWLHTLKPYGLRHKEKDCNVNDEEVPTLAAGKIFFLGYPVNCMVASTQ